MMLKTNGVVIICGVKLFDESVLASRNCDICQINCLWAEFDASNSF